MPSNLTPLQEASLLGPDNQEKAGRTFREQRSRRDLTPRQRASLMGPGQQSEAGQIFEEERKRPRRTRATPPVPPAENLPAVRRDAQARAGDYVNSRDRLMDQGQSRYNAAVNENATRMREPPQGRLTGRGSPSMLSPPTPSARSAMGVVSEAEGSGSRLLNAARNAGGAALRGAAKVAGPAGLLLSPSVAGATLNSPEAQRFLAEDQANRRARQPQAPGGAPSVNAPENIPLPQAPRSAPPRVAAPEDVLAPRQLRNIPAQPARPEDFSRADADMENTMPRPYVGAEIDRVVQSNKPRPNTRSTNRMSPRGMSANDLNEISLAAAQRRGGAEMEPGRSGDIARRIMAREGEQDRQREMENMKRGGPVKKMASGGVVKSSASGRSDGCAVKGKTKGRMV